MTRQRVVALVSFAERLGGAERSMLTLARCLPDRGWVPVLLCPPGPLADLAASRGVAVERLALRRIAPVSSRGTGRARYPVRKVADRSAATLVDAVRLRRALGRSDADVVVSNSLPSHLSAALAGRATGRPVLWHLREMVEPGPGRAVLSGVGRLAAGAVAISAAVAATIDHPRVHVVPNPVDGPPAVVDPLPRPDGHVVGYLGRLDPRKGVEDLVRGVGLLAAPGAHLLVAGRAHAGTDGYVAGLHELARQQVPGRVDFVGQLDEPWPLLAAADVLVVPSLAEPFGRVAVEAQRAGVAVLAADAGGLREIVTDGYDGLLFPPGDPAALARRLRDVLADERLRAALASAGLRTSQRFAPEVHAQEMAALLTRYARPRATRAGGPPGGEH